ncbi:hypothetical protein [Sulfurimonas paralvinellae]|uniref:Uncharacterized protein n=1 Tax=Sulfurimonas paralvinellae TaxID=317658 RepID=A0A7M1B908_9BACT|nr:hypothetical protein [Sulfurimonas paralvinellae]QOP46207.1 hypothetical protein FM071_07830 [Sulfurimonas paralvinellae]
MIKINWDEYKEHKKYSVRDDNFEILLEFMKSFYNMNNPTDIYNTFIADDIAVMMLEKRGIKNAEDLENYLFKL